MSENIQVSLDRNDQKKIATLLLKIPDVWSKVASRVIKQLSNPNYKAKKYLKERVYNQSPSDNYQRTGTALGSILLKINNKLKATLVADTRLKWLHKRRKKRNYMPMLNRNSRIRRLNTHFWDDAIKETIAEAPMVLKRSFAQQFAKMEKKI